MCLVATSQSDTIDYGFVKGIISEKTIITPSISDWNNLSKVKDEVRFWLTHSSTSLIMERRRT